MSNKAINSIKYTGIVTLSQYIGQKKIIVAQVHNSGGNMLFEFLASCLTGDFTTAKTIIPKKIMLLKRTASGVNRYTHESKSEFIFLRTSPEKIYTDTEESAVRYSFAISRDQIRAIDTFDNLGIGLYHDGAVVNTETSTGDIDKYSAFCEVNVNKQALINSSLIVDWELIFSNNAGNY